MAKRIPGQIQGGGVRRIAEIFGHSDYAGDARRDQVSHLRRWQNGLIALLSARFADLDLPHDPFAILGYLYPTDSCARVWYNHKNLAGDAHR